MWVTAREIFNFFLLLHRWWWWETCALFSQWFPWGLWPQASCLGSGAPPISSRQLSSQVGEQLCGRFFVWRYSYPNPTLLSLNPVAGTNGKVVQVLGNGLNLPITPTSNTTYQCEWRRLQSLTAHPQGETQISLICSSMLLHAVLKFRGELPCGEQRRQIMECLRVTVQYDWHFERDQQRTQ
jgi:hypothetical protein